MIIIPETKMTIQDVVDKAEARYGAENIDCIWIKTGDGKYVVASGDAPVLRYEMSEREYIVDLFIWIDKKYVIRET